MQRRSVVGAIGTCLTIGIAGCSDSGTPATDTAADNEQSDSQSVDGEWLSHRAGAGNTGFVDSTGPRTDGTTESWTADSISTIRVPVSSRPVTDGDLVYAPSDGTLYGRDIESGETEFSVSISGVLDGQPAIDGDAIYVLGYRYDEGYFLYSFDLADESTNWRYEVTGSTVRAASSPSVVDGTVYVKDSDNYLHAVDADSGSEVWWQNVDRLTYFTVADGTIYGTLGETRTESVALRAWSVTDGTEQWSYTDFSDPYGGGYSRFVGPPVVSDDGVHVVHELEDATDVLVTIDPASGSESWTYELERSGATAPPTTADGSLFVVDKTDSDEPDRIRILKTADGSAVSRIEVSGSVLSSPTVTPDTLYVAGNSDESGFVAGIDLDSESELWRNRFRNTTFPRWSTTNALPVVTERTAIVTGNHMDELRVVSDEADG